MTAVGRYIEGQTPYCLEGHNEEGVIVYRKWTNDGNRSHLHSSVPDTTSGITFSSRPAVDGDRFESPVSYEKVNNYLSRMYGYLTTGGADPSEAANADRLSRSWDRVTADRAHKIPVKLKQPFDWKAIPDGELQPVSWETGRYEAAAANADDAVLGLGAKSGKGGKAGKRPASGN